nr:hypothetical protein [Tanacetum cinerariifolium]
MSSITAQQTKLDLELVSKEDRLDIRKCNGRIPHGLKTREPTFVSDSLALNPCYSAFLITVDVPEVYMHQFWNSVVSKKQEKMYYPQFTKAIIHHFLIQDKTLSQRNKIGMHTSKDDYLINTLRFVFAKELTRIYGKLLLETLTSLEMKESKAYKTYLSYRSGVVPPKIARKFKKASPSKKDSSLVPVDGEPTKKGKRVKRPAKKSTTTSAVGIFINEDLVKTQSKRKEKVAEKPPSVEKIKPTVTSEGTGDKPGVLDVTKDDSTESETEFWGNDKDDSNDENNLESEANDEENKSNDDKTPSDNENGSDSEQDTNGSESEYESDQQEYEEEVKDDDDKEDEVVHTLSNSGDEDGVNLKSNNDDKIEGDEDRGMDDATNQFNDDVVARLNEPTQTDKEEIVVRIAISSYSSDLALKFLHFVDIHHNDAEIVSLLDVHVHHEVLSTHTSTLLTVPVLVIPESSPVCTTIPQSSQTFTFPLLLKTPKPPPTIETTNTPSTIPDFALVFRINERVNALEKEVVELKKDPLHTQVTALVDDHLDTRMRATREEFMNFLSASLTTRITKQVKNQLPQILPEEVSNFAPHVIEKMIKESLNQVNLAKVSSQPQSMYEAADTLIEFDEAKKTRIKMKALPLDQTEGLKRKRQAKTQNQPQEPEFEVGDMDMPQDQERNLGNDDEPRKESASIRDWFTKPTRPQEPTDPNYNVGKTPQKGPTQNWLMTLAASPSTDKSLKSFDELMSTPIEFSAYIMNGLKISNLTQETLLWPAFRLLKGTRSNYAKLEYDFEECYKALSKKLDWENPKGRDYPFDLTKPLPLVKVGNHQKVPTDYFFNNDLKYLQGGISTMTYTTSLTKTKAANYDLPCIEDMVPNIWSPIKVTLDSDSGRRNEETWLTNLSGDDVADFAIALKMFPEAWPDTVRLDLQKRHPYTPYQDPLGFIYVDSFERNKLMHSDELYKFSDGTLTRLLTSLKDITNIYMRDIPLDSEVVLRYDKRSKSENKGKVPTKMKLVLEQTQQGSSYEVSVSTEGVEELKRKVKIKSVKKEALLILRQKPEHQSDTQVIIMKMEILLEPTSNKLMVGRSSRIQRTLKDRGE